MPPIEFLRSAHRAGVGGRLHATFVLVYVANIECQPQKSHQKRECQRATMTAITPERLLPGCLIPSQRRDLSLEMSIANLDFLSYVPV